MSGGEGRNWRRGVAYVFLLAFPLALLAGPSAPAHPGTSRAFETLFVDGGDTTAEVATPADSIQARLDRFEYARRAFVFAVLVGDSAGMKREADAESAVRSDLDAALRDPAGPPTLADTVQTQWLAAARRDRNLEWSRALLEGRATRWAEEDTVEVDTLGRGSPAQGALALAVGLNARALFEAARETADTASARAWARRAEAAFRVALREHPTLSLEAMRQLLDLAESAEDSALYAAWADTLVTHPEIVGRWTWLPRARALRATGQLAEATEAARSAVATADGADVRALLADLYVEQGLPAAAAQELQKLFTTWSRDARAPSALRRRLALETEYPELALDAGARAALAEPLLPVPASGAESLLVCLADSAGLNAAMRAGIGLRLGRFYYKAKRYPDAEARLLTLLDAPDTAVVEEAQLYLARTYRNTGRPSPMSNHYRTLLKGRRFASDAAWELGREYESLGRWGDAEKAYRTFIDRFPNASRRQDAVFRRGMVRLRRGHRNGAVADFRAALSEAYERGKTERAAYWLARTLHDQGQETAAREAAQAAGATAEPTDYYGVRAREVFALSASPPPGPVLDPPWRPEEPLDSLAARATWSPGTAEHFRRGVALAELGETAEARWEWKLALDGERNTSSLLVALAIAAAVHGVYPEGVWWAEQAAVSLSAGHDLRPGLRRLAFPPAYGADVRRQTARYNLDPALVWAVMRQESAYDPSAVSRAGAIGLLQVMPATLVLLAGEAGVDAPSADVLFLPRVNVALGTRYLAGRLDAFGGRVLPALASYNAGEAKCGEWLKLAGNEDDDWFVESIGYAETYGYVRRIPWLVWLYRRYYGSPEEVHGR